LGWDQILSIKEIEFAQNSYQWKTSPLNAESKPDTLGGVFKMNPRVDDIPDASGGCLHHRRRAGEASLQTAKAIKELAGDIGIKRIYGDSIKLPTLSLSEG
jgi:hypothetical protein